MSSAGAPVPPPPDAAVIYCAAPGPTRGNNAPRAVHHRAVCSGVHAGAPRNAPCLQSAGQGGLAAVWPSGAGVSPVSRPLVTLGDVLLSLASPCRLAPPEAVDTLSRHQEPVCLSGAGSSGIRRRFFCQRAAPADGDFTFHAFCSCFLQSSVSPPPTRLVHSGVGVSPASPSL